MADPNLHLVDDADKLDPSQAPGCGLAAYALLLLTMCLLGLVGMGLATWNLLGQAGEVNPKELTSGAEVDSWRLQPLRDAGLLAEGDVPAAWHDESADFSGSSACAMTPQEVLRVDGTQDPPDARRLAFDDMASVELMSAASGEVVLMTAKEGAGTDVACRFGMREGGNRFLRQVQIELLKRERAAQAEG